MGAHAVPLEHKDSPDVFTDMVIDEMLPVIAEEGLARYCDVFCERGVFSIDQGRRILRAAEKLGMGLKIHADEVHDLGGAGLAAELGAVSAEHLLAANDGNLDRMAASGTIAVLLPGTAYCLRKPYARALAMVAKNVPVALASDCNPGSCFCESMPFVIGLAILNMGLSPEQALVAATLNAAYAIGEEKRCGSLEPGKNADFVVLDGEGPAILAYHAGVNPVARVYTKGRLIVRNI
jgi:imidazolonepropionase